MGMFGQLLVCFLLPGATGQEDQAFVERRRMHDRYMQIERHVRGGRVTPRWLTSSDRFRFRDRNGALREVDPLGGAGPADSTATASEPADRIIEVRDGRVVLRTADGDVTPLTGPGEQDFAWSVPEHSLAPGGRFALAQRIDFRDVHHLSLPDYRQAIPPITRVPYIKTGDTGAMNSLFCIDLESGAVQPVDLGEDREVFLYPVGWQDAGSRALLLRMSRDAHRLDLLAAVPETGETNILLTERRETFVGGLDFAISGHKQTLTLVGDGKRFVWRSERDGFGHLYLYAFDGSLLARLTAGEFVVDRVEAIDVERDTLFYSASTPEAPYNRQIFRVALDGGESTRLTEAPGQHQVEFSPSRRFFVDTHSSVIRPPVSVLRSADGELLSVLEVADVESLESLSWTAPEPFVVRAADGETELHGVLYRPHDFDPECRYPIIDYIYAGPFLSVVQKTFLPGSFMALRAQALAQLGFLVFMVDGRGTPGRGKAFQDVTYGCIGRHEIADHVATLHQLAASRPYIDLQRVGVFGASWGGYFAARAMFTAPEVFHVGVSIAPGDLTEAAVINEPYMDLPERNPEGYAFGSVLHGAENLTGKLLLIHGTSDRNAPFSTTMRIVDTLVRANLPHDLIVIPNADHFFRGPGGDYMIDRALHYLWRHLN